ncbi:MAG: hypothetical protein IPP99_16370 [Chitinophagaceae bacterium]|nr:hypothetical protein [Chitinophagaceae bacterium]
MSYTYDLYTPNDKENSSGSVTDKQSLSYTDFETIFLNMEWDNYPAAPTITVYPDNELPLLWVALFATSEDEEKTRMYIIGYKRMEEKKGFLGFGKATLQQKMTMHYAVGNEAVLKLFREFFNYDPADFLNALIECDNEFSNKTGS